MVLPEEVEQLSELLAGELTSAEAAALRAQIDRRPELLLAWERLASLEALSASLSTSSSDPKVGRAIARALGAASMSQESRSPVAWARAAAAVLVVVTAGWLAWPRRDSAVEIARLTTHAEPARFNVLPGSVVREEGEHVLRLLEGTAMIDGEATVRVADETFSVRGRALFTTEPLRALSHVTAFVTPTQETDQMIQSAKAQWLTAVLAVMVFSGEVQAQQERVVAGRTWSRGPAAPTRPLQQVGSGDKSTGLFDFEQLDLAVLPQRAALARCYQSGLKQNPKLAGRLTALLTISATGKLEEATIGGDYSLQNPFVAACVLSALNQVSFPAPRGVERAQVSYPLQFGPGETGMALESREESPRALSKGLAIPVGDSPSVGPSNAKVTVVLFSDVECSFCVKAHQVLKQLEADYAGRVRFVYKHAGISSHPAGRQAGLALQAAHAQGRFWDLVDLAYSQPVSTERQVYEAQARSLGLDLERFRRDFESPSTAAALDADRALGGEIGLKAVPSWFINGREMMGLQPVATMREWIDDALAAP
jgi:protein-disulfide isomerase